MILLATAHTIILYPLRGSAGLVEPHVVGLCFDLWVDMDYNASQPMLVFYD